MCLRARGAPRCALPAPHGSGAGGVGTVHFDSALAIPESPHRPQKSQLVQRTSATHHGFVKCAHLVPQKDPIRIALVVYPDVDSLDVAGPAQVFALATTLLHARNRQHAGYEVEIVARHEGPHATSAGVKLVPDASFDRARVDVDTLLVAGGPGAERAVEDALLLAFVRTASTSARDSSRGTRMAASSMARRSTIFSSSRIRFRERAGALSGTLLRRCLDVFKRGPRWT